MVTYTCRFWETSHPLQGSCSGWLPTDVSAPWTKLGQVACSHPSYVRPHCIPTSPATFLHPYIPRCIPITPAAACPPHFDTHPQLHPHIICIHTTSPHPHNFDICMLFLVLLPVVASCLYDRNCILLNSHSHLYIPFATQTAFFPQMLSSMNKDELVRVFPNYKN